MKAYSKRKIKKVLRRSLGMRRNGSGNSTGHDVWIDSHGRACQPVMRKKDISHGSLFSLMNEMEAKGITTRKKFMKALRAA